MLGHHAELRGTASPEVGRCPLWRAQKEKRVCLTWV